MATIHPEARTLHGGDYELGQVVEIEGRRYIVVTAFNDSATVVPEEVERP